MGQSVNAAGFRLGWNARWNAGYFPSKEDRVSLFGQQQLAKRMVMGYFLQSGLPPHDFQNTRSKRNEAGEIVTTGETGILKNAFAREGMFYSNHFFSTTYLTLNINVYFQDQGLQNIKKNFRSKKKQKALDLFYLEGEKLEDKKPFRIFSHSIGKGRITTFKKYVQNTIQGIAKEDPYKTIFSNYGLAMDTPVDGGMIKPASMFETLFLQRGELFRDAEIAGKPVFNLVKPLILQINSHRKIAMFSIKSLQSVIASIIPIAEELSMNQELEENHDHLQMVIRTMNVRLAALLAMLAAIESKIFETKMHVSGITAKVRGNPLVYVGKAVALQFALLETFRDYQRFDTLFIGQHNKHVTAHLLLKMMERRLGEYIPINPILGEAKARLSSASRFIAGYKILVTGRLTRKERASVILKTKGSVKLSSQDAKIEYASGFKIMKFGLTGIKIWLTHRTTRTPFLYVIGVSCTFPAWKRDGREIGLIRRFPKGNK